MKTRTLCMFSAVAVVLLIGPMIVYAAMQNRSDLDRFLQQREALLEQLDTNANNLPSGFEHVLTPQVVRAGDEHFPGSGHIRSVIGSGQTWNGTDWSSYDLALVGSARDAAPREVVTELFGHLAGRLGEMGFASPKSGGPAVIIENRRAAHSTWWHNSDRSLLVTMSVVVDTESDSAHVTRYVHERFE